MNYCQIHAFVLGATSCGKGTDLPDYTVHKVAQHRSNQDQLPC